MAESGTVRYLVIKIVDRGEPEVREVRPGHLWHKIAALFLRATGEAQREGVRER